MKFLSFSLLILLLSVVSCDNQSKTNNSSDADSISKPNKEAEKIKATEEAAEQTKDGLGKLLPLTEAQLKALLPATLLGGSQKEAEISNSAGVLNATAEYEIDDSTSITLNVIDCAGPEGVGIYNMQYLNMVNAEEETDEEYTRPITINGSKGMEHCDKTNNYCSLTWFSNRFLITLEGENAGVSKLKQAASGLKLK